MAIPIIIFLGLKLSALTSHNRFIALTSRLAVLGIMLGIATLITVLSVMRGFEYEIRHSLVKEFDHLHIHATSEHYPDALYTELRSLPNVVSVTGYAESYGLVRLHKQYLPMLLLAFESADVENNGIYLSHADAMFLSKEDKVTVLLPSLHKMTPKVSELTYRGAIEGKSTKNRSIVTGKVSYPLYQKITGKYNLTGLSVVVDDLYATSVIKDYIKKKYGGVYQTIDWKDRYQPLFSALKLQRTMMLFILSMITLVAMFSLVSGLVMLSSDRKSEIALLRVMGMSRWRVKQLFLVQGALVGFIGVSLGVILGLTLCYFAQPIAHAVEYLVGFELIDERVYGTSTLPTITEPLMVFSVSAIGFIASILASIYPASRIAKLEVCEVLRYG